MPGLRRLGRHRLQTLVDGVLVRAGERGEHQVAAPGVALGDGQLVAELDGAPDLVDVREVDLRVDALAEQVHAQRHQADVAGALAVAEQAALDAVGAGLDAELGGGHAGAPVVVRVKRQDDRVAAREVAVHPLDGVGVDVRRRHLHRGRQVDDHRVLGGRLPDVTDRVDDLLGVRELRAGVRLGRVLEAPVRVRAALRLLADERRAVDRDLRDARAVGAEDDAPLEDRGRVVEVHDRGVRALERGEGPTDQLRARLGQHLDADVGGDRALGDDLADEVEVGLRGGGEADFDLLVAHAHEQVEHAALAGRAHRVDEGLVAVAQVDRAPERGLGDDAVGPGAVGQRDALDLVGERLVTVDRHAAGPLGVPGRLSGRDVAVGMDDGRPDVTHRDVGRDGHEGVAPAALREWRPAARITRGGGPVWVQTPPRRRRSSARAA